MKLVHKSSTGAAVEAAVYYNVGLIRNKLHADATWQSIDLIKPDFSPTATRDLSVKCGTKSFIRQANTSLGYRISYRGK